MLRRDTYTTRVRTVSSLDSMQLRFQYSFLRKVAGLPERFSYKALAAATDGFQSLLGRGASGMVFKGILDDGTPVAVKCIECAEHGEEEFRTEVAAIAGAQHINLVRLLGYCLVSGGPNYLVYEYIHNGSLDKWIFADGNGDDSRCLPWRYRYQVAIDVAKALAYLHHDCRSRVLHLDVKPENILLDEGFRAVVSDFGLSKLMKRDESRVITTVRGTKGYLAPEWLLGVGVTEKSDIYSYGMVLFELVAGRRSFCLIGNGEWSYLPRIMADKVKEGKVMEVVDERLMTEGTVEEKQLMSITFVAMWCIQENACLRPSMARVVDMLEGRMAVDAPPKPEMTLLDLLSIDQTDGDDGPFGVHRGSSPAKLPAALSSGYTFAMSTISGR
ncbi:probable receptor-like protein kinase At5g20050 [Typha angustifolia]|uniref:probable receptor-like protein kinase At5g20050 n=1 Tax=Typha angustifolia TaxID=59011 RepID=UPI003C2C66AB